MDPRSEYLDRFYDAADAVASGRAGAISEDRRLRNTYRADYVPMMAAFLQDDDERVRCEVVYLFAEVRERSVEDEVRRMSKSDTQRVRDYCLGYLKALEADDGRIPGLIDTIQHSRGEEYHSAAVALAKIARPEDVDAVREVYGLTEGPMREDARAILEGILERNPPLRRQRNLILSLPVYPDEAAFDRFLDRSMEYLDVRYREKVHPLESVGLTTYNNVATAINKIRVRLYNEADNLEFYGPDMADRHLELSKVLSWAAGDLAGKRVIRNAEASSMVCARCGGMMVMTKSGWVCPEGCRFYRLLNSRKAMPPIEPFIGATKEKCRRCTADTGTTGTGTGLGNSSKLRAPTAGPSARCPSSPLREGRSTAGTASGSTSPKRGTGAGSESLWGSGNPFPQTP